MNKISRAFVAVAAVAVLGIGAATAAYAASSSTPLGSAGGSTTISVPGVEFEDVANLVDFVPDSHNHEETVSAQCSTGFVPISGGYRYPDMYHPSDVYDSYPDRTNNRWTVNILASYGGTKIEVHAICAKFTN